MNYKKVYNIKTKYAILFLFTKRKGEIKKWQKAKQYLYVVNVETNQLNG